MPSTKRLRPPQTPVKSDEPFFHEIQAYMTQFCPLLDAEQTEDEAVLKERLLSWSLDRLKAEGYCLTGLRAFWLETHHFGRPVASFTLGPGIPLPKDHRFEIGTHVLVSKIDPLQEEPLHASVTSCSETQLRLAFPELADLHETEWRLDLGITNIAFQRMRAAITHLHYDPSIQAERPELILQGTYLRDILLKSFSSARTAELGTTTLQAPDDVDYPPPEKLDHGSRISGEHEGIFRDDMRIRSWVKRHSMVNPLKVEGDPQLPLNDTQIRATAMMIGERISLVHGPPGTGKTKTIIEAIKLLKMHFQVVHPILVCTYTNVAVDNLVEALAAAGVKPLRVGYGGKVKESLYKHTLDYKLEHHPLKIVVVGLAKKEDSFQTQISALEKEIARLTDATSRAALVRKSNMEQVMASKQRTLGAVRSKKYALCQRMLHDVANDADVICTTCITSACAALNVVDFPLVFLDEASMSTEPASLIPLMKGSQQVALIGDHKQLPPVIRSQEALKRGFDVSLFERLAVEGEVPSIMLDVQYRMHPTISLFPSAEFYNFALRDGTVDSLGNVCPSLVAPYSSHVKTNPATGNRPSMIFLDHSGSEATRDRSRVNRTEAEIICSLVEDLLLCNERLYGKDIGIIAPYAAQISLLTRLFQTDKKYQKRFKTTLGDHRAMQLANIEIKTVDGFEGREKEVIIFSTVRNNPFGYIGFLADRRRLNVGLTRAKRGLFVVGSISTLRVGKFGWNSQPGTKAGKGGDTWQRYVRFLRDHGLVISLRGEKLEQMLSGSIQRIGNG